MEDDLQGNVKGIKDRDDVSSMDVILTIFIYKSIYF